jgi:mannose-1-phosphate guanylyltransferase
MVPVLNKPFFEYVIRHLSSHGIKDIVLAQSRFSRSVESYYGNGSQFGVRLIYSMEDSPLGTAGAVKNAEDYLNETFLVLNGDIFTNLDVAAMIAFHRARKAKVTIALTPVADPTSYGLIETSDQGRVTRFVEKPGRDQITTNMINAGTYVLEPEVMASIPHQTKFSFERELFPQLLSRGAPVYAYPSAAYWMDIGTPEKYLQLHRDLLCSKDIQHTSPAGEGIVIGAQSSVDSTSQMKGPILIGINCTIGHNARLIGPVVIGAGSTISEDVVIESSVIWQNVRLEARVELRDSILASGCCLKAGCIVHGSVLGSNVTVASGAKLEPGSRLPPSTEKT